MIQLTTDLLAHVPKRRNGENGRRDAHQWDLSIYARLTRQGASLCSTMRYWVSCERCRGSRMCGTSPSTAHTMRICPSDGRRSNRMALQSHPPSNCKHFQHLVNLGATWRHWLSDSAVVLGLMTARRSRPQEKISDFCAEPTPLLESIQPAQRNLQALPHVWATRAANVCVAVRGNRSWFKASRKTWTRGRNFNPLQKRNPINRPDGQ